MDLLREVWWRWGFPAWLAAFYLIWGLIVVVGEHWTTIQEHWAIALAMALGSYIAGATPMGGGTVGFPVLVLFFDYPATLGRDFSFAVQSIGMVSASVFILWTRRPVAWSLLGWACLGVLVGIPVGLLWIAPLMPGDFIKMLFAVIWASFGIMTLQRLREISTTRATTPTTATFDCTAGLSVGLLGGIFLASITGGGVDMLIYAVLILLLRSDLRVATPTSVILMAFASVVGLATQTLTSQLDPQTFGNWVAAAPVVALGAPLGALVVNLVGRRPTLAIIAVLCLLQFVWIYYQQWVETSLWSLVLGGVGLLLFNGMFQLMYRRGKRMEEASRALMYDDTTPERRPV